MSKIVSKPAHGSPIGTLDGKPIFLANIYQSFFDDFEQKVNDKLLGESVKLHSYTVATLPSALKNKDGIIAVSDETGGDTFAKSDGTNWRRPDRAIVS